MKQVIEKAIKKAASKGLDASETADLVLEYLEVAGDIGNLVLIGTEGPPPLPNIAMNSNLISPPAVNNVIISANSAVNRVLRQADSFVENPWTTSTLLTALSQVDWSFTVKPDGHKEEQKYNATIYPVDSSGQGSHMEGVRVVFKAEDRDFDRQEWAAFFPCSQAEIDPLAIIEGQKDSLRQLFRVRTEPILPKTVQTRTTYPTFNMNSTDDGKARFN